MLDSTDTPPPTPACPSVAETQGYPSERTAYWRKQLSGLVPLQLPSDHARVALQTFRRATQPLVFSERLNEALKALSHRDGVTIFVVLLAAFKTLLHRYTAQLDILVGSIATDISQPHSGTSVTLSDMAVPLRTDLSGNPTFRELLKRVQGVTSQAYSRADGLFDLLRKEPQSASLPPVIFSFRSRTLTPGSVAQTSWPWSRQAGHPCHVEGAILANESKYELHLEVEEQPEGMLGRLNYSRDLFDPDRMSRMAGHWGTLVEGAVSDPTLHLSDLPLLRPAELRQLVVEWNDTAADYPAMCLHELIEAQVQRTPDAVAVIFENQQLSYRELNARANQLAHYLRRLGIRPDVLVGICVERSIELVIALLGVLKAGGAYVPLDPQYPAGRLSLMVEDSGLKTLVTQEAFEPKFSGYQGQLVCLDRQREAIWGESRENESAGAKADNLAYVIYTSGSTGKPKGVQISHRSLVNFLVSMRSSPGLTAKDTLLAVTTISFDIAALELYLPLTVGARVVLVSRETAMDGHELRATLAESAATVMQATPVTWQLLLEAGWQGSKDLKVLCGGEPMPRELANELSKRASSIWNLYGPTETTVWSTVWRITSGEAAITIGRPIANTEIYILDSHLHPVPIGVPGELYIGGDGVGRGYLHRPELTAQKFVPNPFNRQNPRRLYLYATGDLARYHPNGEIECLGRIDDQVKLRGFRIELGEIERVLGEHAGLRQNAVVAREDDAGEKCLVAYVVAASGSQLSTEELRDFLKQRLPEYMLPPRFVFLEALPCTPNGKVNRRALPAPQQLALTGKQGYVAPKDAIECQLVTIWEQVLKVQLIGRTDNFFELGGSSLSAVRLMQRIEHQFGKKLAIATLFQAPTIEQLAIILRQEGCSQAWSSLVAIRSGGCKPPFFCVHGAGGVVIRFYDLARYLGPDQPFYGLQAQGADGKLPCHTRVEDMAAHYIREMRSVQPEGPYFLGGYSFGGLVAFEMAQQLVAHGQNELLLVLFDTFCPAQTLSMNDAALICKRIARGLLSALRLPPKERLRYLSQKAAIIGRGIQRRVSPPRLSEVRRACEQAAKDYLPRVYPGRIILFRSSQRPPTQLRELTVGWRTYAAQGLETHEIPGDHDNIFLEPQVRSVAEQLRVCLNRAQQHLRREDVLYS